MAGAARSMDQQRTRSGAGRRRRLWAQASPNDDGCSVHGPKRPPKKARGGMAAGRIGRPRGSSLRGRRARQHTDAAEAVDSDAHSHGNEVCLLVVMAKAGAEADRLDEGGRISSERHAGSTRADKNRLRIDGHTGILDLFACAQPCREPPSYNPSRAPHRQRYTTPWRSSCSLARRWPPSPSLTSPWAPSSASTSAPPTRCATAQPHLIAPACSH